MEWSGHGGKVFSLVWAHNTTGGYGTGYSDILLSTGPDGNVVNVT